MLILPVIFNLFTNMAAGNINLLTLPDPCEAARAGAAVATLTAKDSSFLHAVTQIKNAYQASGNEHCISFGKDAGGNIIASPLSNGSATSGKVPAMPNAFADLHNHPNNLPPDAGDFYGLAQMNMINPGYSTRFALTKDGSLYALLVTDAEALQTFIAKHPPQPPAFKGGPKGFAVAITDEAREMKYNYHCTDEMVLAFILEKYNTGVCLLKQNSTGALNKIITTVTKNGDQLLYSVFNCR